MIKEESVIQDCDFIEPSVQHDLFYHPQGVRNSRLQGSEFIRFYYYRYYEFQLSKSRQFEVSKFSVVDITAVKYSFTENPMPVV